MTKAFQTEWRQRVRAAGDGARRFWYGRGAAAAVESVMCLVFTVVMLGGVFEVVGGRAQDPGRLVGAFGGRKEQ